MVRKFSGAPAERIVMSFNLWHPVVELTMKIEGIHRRFPSFYQWGYGLNLPLQTFRDLLGKFATGDFIVAIQSRNQTTWRILCT